VNDETKHENDLPQPSRTAEESAGAPGTPPAAPGSENGVSAPATADDLAQAPLTAAEQVAAATEPDDTTVPSETPQAPDTGSTEMASSPAAEAPTDADSPAPTDSPEDASQPAGEQTTPDEAVSDQVSSEAWPDDAFADDEEDDEEEEDVGDVEPLELNLEDEQPEEEIEKDWYILKVQSNRESSIRDGLARRVQVAGLDRFFGDIIVPTEDVAEFKSGKKRVVKRKMYPGYIVVHMAINDDTWFLVRETPGIGDFTGAAGKPTPMLSHEVDRILKAMKTEEEGGEVVKTAIPFKPGDRVRIKEGTFENFEGEVEEIDEANGRVTVMINIFGRSTPAELEHWQIESL
jgi:transcriptional antiterminator NusG